MTGTRGLVALVTTALLIGGIVGCSTDEAMQAPVDRWVSAQARNGQDRADPHAAFPPPELAPVRLIGQSLPYGGPIPDSLRQGSTSGMLRACPNRS